MQYHKKREIRDGGSRTSQKTFGQKQLISDNSIPQNSTEVYINTYDFHKLCLNAGKVGWCCEDAFSTLLSELSNAGLIDKGNPKIDDCLQSAWLKMARNAVYFPKRLRKWSCQFNEAAP